MLWTCSKLSWTKLCYFTSLVDLPLHSKLNIKSLKWLWGPCRIWLPLSSLWVHHPTSLLTSHPTVLGHSTQTPTSGLGSLQPHLGLQPFPRPPHFVFSPFSEVSPILSLYPSPNTPYPTSLFHSTYLAHSVIPSLVHNRYPHENVSSTKQGLCFCSLICFYSMA